MGLGDVSLACATAMVDALVVGGVRHASLSPGSRSTALALAFARHDGVTVHVNLDERAGAFFALGVAKVTGVPAIALSTSGTAAAEFFPAVVEASQSRTPMILLTADRPPRVRGTGANQTIDQMELYGRYARAYLEPPVPSAPTDAAAWADEGWRAVEAALGPSPGPVQVNCPFDEPLVPEGEAVAVPELAARAPASSEPDHVAARAAVDAFLEAHAGRRGVITIGSLPHPGTLSLLSLGAMLGWPVLAEPLSGLRLDAGDAGRSLAAGQFLAGDPSWLASHAPEIVLQVGATPTTRASQALVASAGTLVVLDRDHLDPDPEGRAERRILVDPELFAAVAWDAHAGDAKPASPEGWLVSWREADQLTRAAVDRTLDGFDEPFEGRVARDLARFVPHGAVLAVGSSSPVRDLDAFMAPRRPPRIWNPSDLVRVLANRGASGIDGFVSTVLGAGAADVGPVYAVLGDLTVLHDAGSLLWSARRGLDAVLVVSSNGGGRIFSRLGQSTLPEHEDLFVTPHGFEDLSALCAAAGAGYSSVERSAELEPTLEAAARGGGVHIIEVSIDPAADLRRRTELTALERGSR